MWFWQRWNRSGPAGLKFILEPLLSPDNDNWCRELETKAVYILSGRYSWDPAEVLYIFTWKKQNFNVNTRAGLKSRPVTGTGFISGFWCVLYRLFRKKVNSCTWRCCQRTENTSKCEKKGFFKLTVFLLGRFRNRGKVWVLVMRHSDARLRSRCPFSVTGYDNYPDSRRCVLRIIFFSILSFYVFLRCMSLMILTSSHILNLRCATLLKFMIKTLALQCL
jgi:hypothetical protein